MAITFELKHDSKGRMDFTHNMSKGCYKVVTTLYIVHIPIISDKSSVIIYLKVTDTNFSRSPMHKF